jgi:hypothetical protein
MHMNHRDGELASAGRETAAFLDLGMLIVPLQPMIAVGTPARGDCSAHSMGWFKKIQLFVNCSTASSFNA